MKDLFKKVLSRRNIKIILGLIILVILLWVIANTYSKYINSLGGTASTDIANWNIKINNLNISSNPDFSNVLGFVLDSNSNIASDVIVPTSSGTFTINLDSTGTDLPFTYDFSIAEDIDTSSTYQTVQRVDPWQENGTTKYQLEFTIDYTYSNKPVVYRFNTTYDYNYMVNVLHLPWDEGYAWGLVYNDIRVKNDMTPIDTATYGTDPVGLPITITLPAGMTLDRVYNCATFDYDSTNNTVTFIPAYYDWLRNNTSTTRYVPDWDPSIELSEYCIENIVKIQLDLSYVPPGGINTIPDVYWTSVSANGRMVMKKNLSDFRITRYQINDGTIETLAPGDTNITGTVQPSLNADGTNTGNQVLNKFKFWVEWYDAADNVSDNFHDVMASKMDNPYRNDSYKSNYDTSSTRINYRIPKTKGDDKIIAFFISHIFTMVPVQVDLLLE